MPERLQLRRTKGWRKPPDAVVVSRPSRWGNPYILVNHGLGRWGLEGPDIESHQVPSIEEGRRMAVDLFRSAITSPRAGELLRFRPEDVALLAGRDLCCWCPPGPCHADVLLELAGQCVAA